MIGIPGSSTPMGYGRPAAWTLNIVEQRLDPRPGEGQQSSVLQVCSCILHSSSKPVMHQMHTGTQVAVYGTLGPVGSYVTQSTYTINQDPPNSFSAPNRIDKVQYQIRFYMSAQLPYSNYTLTIVNQGDSFYLDYIEVTVPDDFTPTHDSMFPNVSSPTSQISQLPSSSFETDRLPPTSITTITTSSGPESAQPSSVTSPSSSLSDADSSRSSISLSPSMRSTKLGHGGIVGIAIASFTALIGCLVLLYFYLRRRRADAEADPTTALMTPFRRFSPFPLRSPVLIV